MKLKPKHFEIAKTISYFVDRNYYPDFKFPSREQIDLFTQIESRGVSHLSENDKELVAPMLNGKAQYDLQIKMIHQELKDWAIHKWGWYAPMDSIFRNAWIDRKELRTYIKFLIKLTRNLRKEGFVPTLVQYSGFSENEKNELIKSL